MTEIQKFITDLVDDCHEEDVLRTIRKKLLSSEYQVDTNWRDYSNSYILNVSNRSKLDDAFVRQCNGVIFDQDTHRIICYSFPVFRNEEDYPADPEQEVEAESMYDGTLMKLYWCPSENRWRTATTKCFDASRSRWSSQKTFHELLMNDTMHDLDLDTLDKNKCYIGILIHPENKLVSDYYHCKNETNRFTTPVFVHTGTCNLETLEFEDDYEKLASRHAILPEKKTFSSVADMKQALLNEKEQPIRPGYVVKIGTERYKFMTPSYIQNKELRGNVQNMRYRLLEFQGRDEILEQFLESFPEYIDLEKEVKEDVMELSRTIYRHYSNYYFRNQRMRRMPPAIFEAVKAVNWRYRDELRKVGDKSLVLTNPTTIAQFLVSRYPFDKLVELLGPHYIKNTNRHKVA